MGFFNLPTATEKEWIKLVKQEEKFLSNKAEKQQSKLNEFLEQKIPANLQDTLDKAFSKAFGLVFQKGTGIIEKTYNKEKAEDTFAINSIGADKKRPKRKALRAFSKTAAKSGNANLAFSAVSGVGLGILGTGIPDIVLFVSTVLKSLYQIALSYGKDYNDEEEKRFILLLIRGAVTFGDEQRAINDEIDYFIENGRFTEDISMEQAIENASECLSGELLYMKFLQGIPIVGAIGGAYDPIYMSSINKYARIKYHKRFLIGRL